MKAVFILRKQNQSGSALVLTMIMSGIALAILGGAMTWSSSNTRLTHRSIQYTRSVAAAEGGTEKVLSQLTRDFLNGGEKLVVDNLGDYRRTVPKPSDSSFWKHWKFNDGDKPNHTYVERSKANNFTVINSTYAGLRAFVSTYTVVSHAQEKPALQNVVGGVLQELELAQVPIFQFAMYSSSDMEISCGQPFAITGKVHANKMLYVEPDNALTFQSDVTAVMDILFQRHPDDTRGNPKGAAVYEGQKSTPVSALTLPIGTTNTPEAIREIIQPPPPNENFSSALGRLRYYNQADMIIEVSDTGIIAKSGNLDNFKTLIPTNEVAAFVSTTSSFRDAREEKTVRPVDINVGILTTWSQTNSNLRGALGSKDVSSVYVLDNRTLAGTDLAAVRVINGRTLPSRGLTVSTARPLYVFGHYNQTNTANLATTNTITTRPASLVADAITILSENWQDVYSTDYDLRNAKSTTVNAALLTGVVETTPGHYSGGMENFPRFLEKWGLDNVFTYNGSMVRMFPSKYATNYWGKSFVYDPPKRNWAYDLNFNNPTNLPPLTPSLLTVSRSRWATVAPSQNAIAIVP